MLSPTLLTSITLVKLSAEVVFGDVVVIIVVVVVEETSALLDLGATAAQLSQYKRFSL